MSLRRQGRLLIVPRDLLMLPGFCVKCGEPATVNLRKTFYWHSAIFYVLLVIPILYALIAGAFRTSMTLGVPLCRLHLKRRRLLLASGFLLLLGCVPLGWVIGRDAGVLIGVGMFVSGLVLTVLGNGIIRPVRMTASEATYAGCGRAYLDKVAGGETSQR